MLLSALSVLVVAQSSSEISEGLMNNPVLSGAETVWKKSYREESGTPFVFNTFVPEGITVFKIMKRNVQQVFRSEE